MNPSFGFRRALAVGFIGLASLALPAAADTIFQDDFTTAGTNRGGSYTSSLAGTAPTVGAGTWTFAAESGGWGQTGAGFATPSSSNFLPFTPVAGFIYTLTATMDWTSDPGGDRWMVLAFTNFDNHNWNGTGNYFTTAGANTLTEAVLVRPGDATQTYTITLDTTAPGWTNTAGYANVGWIVANAGPANIGASRITNFSLTSVASGVPNPTVTYDGNGSDNAAPTDGSSPYTSGATVTVLGTGTMTRAGYNFQSWNSAAAGNGTNLNPGATFTILNNTTLYARWLPATDYVWNNGAATDTWNGTDANWSGATWTNSASNNAFFTSVGGTVNLATITVGSVNVGNSGSNFANITFTGGSLSASSLTAQGFFSNGGNYAASPTLSIDSDVTISGDAAVGRANLTINSGTLTADRIISAPASADWGRLVVSGGTVIATNGVDGSVNTGATFAIELNSGTLETPSVRVANRDLDAPGPGGNNDANLLLNGGTLKATGANNADFITTYGGGSNAFVASGGAIIDTNGRNTGILVNLLDAGGAGGLTKDGAGTLTLGGANTYVGDTTVNAGTLVLADNSQLKFVVTESPASNRVTGSGTATFNGDFNIDTTAVSGTTGSIWTLVDRATLTGETFDDTTFTVVGFTDSNNDGVWIMTDAKGDWSFSEATGELTLDVGTDYDDWKTANGVIGGENADDDNDGLTNHEEYAFGLDPTGGSSVNPITVQFSKTSGTFTYTRRDPSLPDPTLTYTVWYSTDLATWTQDTGATEGITTLSGEVQTVPVTISPALLTNPKLFIQVRAN